MTVGGYQIQLFAQSADAPVNWRLLSGNNREVGRGGLGYADVEPTLRALALLQRDTGRMHARMQRVEPNRWRWELDLGGTTVALSSHTFDRQIRCQLGLKQFLAGFGAASVRPGLVVSGARRWERAS